MSGRHGHDHEHGEAHGHEHAHPHGGHGTDDPAHPHNAPLSDVQLRVKALESLLTERELGDPAPRSSTRSRCRREIRSSGSRTSC
jgi:hypothetical protein